MSKRKAPNNGHAPREALVRLVRGAGVSQPDSRLWIPTPLGAIACGLVAGAIGTAAMDTLLFPRYRREGGESSAEAWELSEGITSSEEAPAPAEVGRRVVEGLFQVKLSSSRAPLVNNVMHWAYGMIGGAQYGIVSGSLSRTRSLVKVWQQMNGGHREQYERNK